MCEAPPRHALAEVGRVNRDDARPLRTVVFAPGDDADALAETAASGADSMVVDLEEPQHALPRVGVPAPGGARPTVAAPNTFVLAA